MKKKELILKRPQDFKLHKTMKNFAKLMSEEPEYQKQD